MSCLLLTAVKTTAQTSNYGQSSSSSAIQYDSQGRPIRAQKGGDSLQHRDRYADSITIFYRYFDSTRIRKLDSSLNDFFKDDIRKNQVVFLHSNQKHNDVVAHENNFKRFLESVK